MNSSFGKAAHLFRVANPHLVQFYEVGDISYYDLMAQSSTVPQREPDSPRFDGLH